MTFGWVGGGGWAVGGWLVVLLFEEGRVVCWVCRGSGSAGVIRETPRLLPPPLSPLSSHHHSSPPPPHSSPLVTTLTSTRSRTSRPRAATDVATKTLPTPALKLRLGNVEGGVSCCSGEEEGSFRGAGLRAARRGASRWRSKRCVGRRTGSCPRPPRRRCRRCKTAPFPVLDWWSVWRC